MKRSQFFLVLCLSQLLAVCPSWAQKNGLNGLSLDDPKYLDVFSAVQKNHYQEQKWDEFFSHALFYRHKFLNNKGKLSQNYQSSLVTLEVLALTKHCQWDETKKTLQALLELSSDQDEIKKELQDLLTKVELMEAHQIRLPLAPQKKQKVILPKQLQWKAGAEVFAKLNDPSKIKVKVKNLCQ